MVARRFTIVPSLAFLLPSISSCCQSPLTSKSGIIVVSVKSSMLLHSLGLPGWSPNNCLKTKLLRIEWRQGNCFSPCIKISDGRQMRYINAILAMEPGTAYHSLQATIDHQMLTNNSEQLLTISSINKRELSTVMGPVQNHASLHTIKPSADGSLLLTLKSKDAEKQGLGEKEKIRRKKISEANKGRIPWNKGKKGNCRNADEGSTSQTEVKVLIRAEDKENLRRQRISEANKGKVPWNKGGKHSSETKKRIRAGVIERMKDPKIREKLRAQAEAVKLSPDIKLKIRTGIIRAWNRKRELKARQELCLQEWNGVIAETARRGSEGEMEYQWDSYSIIKKQALKCVPEKKRSPVRRPDHLSAEHRLRIAAAIKAKWSDPEYRINVQNGIRNYVSKRPIQMRPPHQTRRRAEPRLTFSVSSNSSITSRKSASRSKGDFVTVKHDSKGARKSVCKSNIAGGISSNSRHKKESYNVRHGVAGSPKRTSMTEIMEQDPSKTSTDVPAYKDPETGKKLEKLKSMRAHRVHVEAKKQKEITERARALIAQAQVAAKALEAAAIKDKKALAPLLETRRLLAEAVHSLEALNLKKASPEHRMKEHDLVLYAQVMSLANAASSSSREKDGPEWEIGNVESTNLHIP